jgi:hypothetical protein
MYFYFIKNLKKNFEIYTSHPVFEQSHEKYFDNLRKILRLNMKMNKNNDRETMRNILGMNSHENYFGNNVYNA